MFAVLPFAGVLALAVACTNSSQQGTTGSSSTPLKTASQGDGTTETLGNAQQGNVTQQQQQQQQVNASNVDFNQGTGTTNTAAPANTTPAPAPAPAPVSANNTIANQYAGLNYQNPTAAALADSNVWQFTNGTNAAIKSIQWMDGSTNTFSPIVPPGKIGQVLKYQGFDDGQNAAFVLVLDNGQTCQGQDTAQNADSQGWGIIVQMQNGQCIWKANQGGGGGSGPGGGGTPGTNNPTARSATINPGAGGDAQNGF